MKNISCIIIDDENPARKLIAIFLKKKGNINVVAEANNGFEAVKLIDEHKPDLIFLDIQMPKLNGFEVLYQLYFKMTYFFRIFQHEIYSNIGRAGGAKKLPPQSKKH